MNYTTARLAAIGLSILAWACSDKSSNESTTSAQGGTAGNNGSMGGGGGSTIGGTTARTSTGPAIASAPADWARPTDCGGIGNRCPNLSGCEARSMCQSMGDVCIPALPSGSNSMPSKSSEYPYCAAYTCMTFEEASCFCTGAAGETVASCASPSQMAGLCVAQGKSCTTSTCCSGFSCVHGVGTAMVCEQSCDSNEDCTTGCCTDLRDTGDKICAAAEACETLCKKRGEACTPGTASASNDCCQGACVTSENPNFAGCRPRCNKDADCVSTGCCSMFADGASGFCVDARYCSCGEEDAPCGQPETAACCSGQHCVGSVSANEFRCAKDCKTNADCPSNCCTPVTGVDYMICSPSTRCPS